MPGPAGKTSAPAPPPGRLLGHAHAREVLGRAAAEGRPAQAYVFSGPEGVGKHACGRWFARLLLCTGRASHALEPCDDCLSCRKVLSGSHPDIEEMGLGDKRATIGVDEVRALQLKAQFAPMEGAWRIFLLTEAHRLTPQAMNCLLKTLEEPQARHVFVLMTPTHGALLPTILSRCQLVRLAPLEAREVCAWLQGLGVEREPAELAASLSEGRPGMAHRMVGDKRLWEFRARIMGHAVALSSSDGNGLMQIAEKLDEACGAEKRLPAERVLEMLTMWFRDVLWVQRGLDEGRVLNVDHRDALRAAAQRYAPERVLGAMTALREAREHLGRNVNVKLLFTRLVLHLRP